MTKGHAVILEDTTGEPRIIVIDADNLDDPAWNPEGHTQIEISDELYKSGKGLEHHAKLISYAKAEHKKKLTKRIKE